MSWIHKVVVPVLLFLGTFITGTLPLYYASYSPSERGLSLMSKLGLGMLLGVAFVLVIPEGLERVDSNFVGFDLLAGFMLTYLAESLVKQKRDIQGTLRQFAGNGVVVALVLHGFADGLVLGTTVNQVHTLLVLMLAVTVHRIPVVLSLVSVLVSRQRLARGEVVRHLLVFSLSSPCGYTLAAVCEFTGIIEGFGGHLLLASGGSLLYAGFALGYSSVDAKNKEIVRPFPSPSVGREASDEFIILDPPEDEPENDKFGPLLVAGGTVLPSLISLFGGKD